MKKFITNIRADNITSKGFIISLTLFFITIIFIFIYYGSLPPLIPIFNQLPWGPQRLVPTLGIFIPIIIFTLIYIFNLIFSSIVYTKNPLIARIVAATTLLISIINFIFIIRTVLVTI